MSSYYCMCSPSITFLPIVFFLFPAYLSELSLNIRSPVNPPSTDISKLHYMSLSPTSVACIIIIIRFVNIIK